MRLHIQFFFTVLLVSGVVDCGVARGQDNDRRYTMVLRGVEMHEALEELARITEIDLIYSSDLVADREVYCNGRTLQAEPLLRCILTGSGLDFVRSSTGTYVLIESLRDNPLFGDVAGRIVDGMTGEPLPHANVLLADASSGTATNDAGLFSFSSVVSGRHQIHVTYVGYESAVDSVVVEPGSRNTITIEMAPTTHSMEPVVIDGLTQRLPSRGLGSEAATEIDRVGTLGTPDVARAAASITGVSMRPPLADLHIQGGDAGEHLTLIDGVPVRDPVTLGRHLSAFSPLAINRITVHKAGFGVSHGSHLSGVVSLVHDVAAGENQVASLLVDPVSMTGKVQGRVPVTDTRRVDAMVSHRTSVWDYFQDPGLESLLDRWNAVDPILAGIWIREPVSSSTLTARRHLPDLAFSDLHAAAQTSLSEFSTLHTSFYRARNRIGSELAAVNADDGSVEDRLMLTRDDYDWANWAGQMRHTWLQNARSVIMMQVMASGHRSNYDYLSLHDEVPAGTVFGDLERFAAELRPALEGAVGSKEVNRIREVTGKASLNRSFSPGRHVDFSLEATRIESWFELGNQFVAPISHKANAWEMAGYADGSLSLGLRTTVEPGLRVTYLPDRQTLYAEPRLALRFDRSVSPIGPYALRAAGGLYRQFIPSFDLTSSGSTSVVPFVRFWLPSDHSLAPSRAYHISAEGLLMPDERWTVSVEGYYKWHPRLLMLDYASLLQNYPSVRPRPEPMPVRQSDFIAATSGRSLGGSVRLSYVGSRQTTSVQYGYSLAERRFPHRFGGELQPVPWNEPHHLAANARFSLTSFLSVHVEGEAMWGRQWPLRRSYYDFLALRPDPPSFTPFDLDDPTNSTVPAYYDVDLGITYEIAFNPVTLRARAVLANVFDRQNVYDWSLEPGPSDFRTVDRALPGRRPILSLRLLY